KACVLPENPASYRVVRTKSYLFNKAPFTRYRITTGEGKVFEGRTDAEGKTVAVYTALPDALHIELL
ncbi:hypothetical protein RAF47_09200, partial [Klebsiella pneumoniae]